MFLYSVGSQNLGASDVGGFVSTDIDVCVAALEVPEGLHQLEETSHFDHQEPQVMLTILLGKMLLTPGYTFPCNQIDFTLISRLLFLFVEQS